MIVFAFTTIAVGIMAIVCALGWRNERRRYRQLQRQKNAPPYVFGSSAPRGSAHMPDLTFDCSELVREHAEQWERANPAIGRWVQAPLQREDPPPDWVAAMAVAWENRSHGGS